MRKTGKVCERGESSRGVVSWPPKVAQRDWKRRQRLFRGRTTITMKDTTP